jgi:hypothetical protein
MSETEVFISGPRSTKTRKVRVKLLHVLLECFKGGSYVQVDEVEDPEIKEYGVMNVKEEDI